MNKIYFLITFLLTIILLNVKSQFCDTDNLVNYNPTYYQEYQIDFKKTEHCNTIRLNIHFFLKADGTGNFNEEDDGFGNTNLSGYDLAFEIIKRLNETQESNPKLNIPPNNNIPNLPKNFDFELNGVFFHRDENAYIYQNTPNIGTSFGSDENEVINIFYTFDPIRSEVGGYASSLTPTSILFTEMSMYRRYTDYINALINKNLDHIDWWYHALINTTAHEIGHLLSLSHVVANTCSTCDDFCDDTPTRQEMIDNWGINPNHCGWANLGFGCTNNLMDYGGYYSLSPCQLNRIYSAFFQENGVSRHFVCNQLSQDVSFCEFDGYPQISYYGNKIRIAPCLQQMMVEEVAILHYNEDVEFFSNFEVVGYKPRNNNLIFEVRQHCVCEL